MDVRRRKRLNKVIEELRDLAELEEAAHDNLPESFQGSEHATVLEDNAVALKEAVELLEGVA